MTEQATERKAKRKAKQQQILAAYHGSISGNEPEFGADQHLWSETERRDAVLNALNYYNSMLSPEARRKKIQEYVHDNLRDVEPLTLSIVWSKLKDWEIPNSLVAYCLMRAHGLQYTKDEQAYVAATFKKLLGLSASRQRGDEAKDERPQKSIQDRIDAQAAAYIGAVEEMVDKFITDGCKTPPALKDWFAEQSVKGIYAKRIAQFFTRNRDEVYQALKKKDEQLVEGYAVFGKKLKDLHSMYAGLVNDAAAWGGAKAQERQPAVKKAKAPEKQVKRMQYQAEDKGLGLVSIAPAKIVGAGNLWTFNTKTRQLGWYHAADEDGLRVKGTTILNYDEKESGLKKVRKPEQIIPLIMGGQRPAEKVFHGIKAKKQAATGRVNKLTVLLRVHAIL